MLFIPVKFNRAYFSRGEPGNVHMGGSNWQPLTADSDMQLRDNPA